MLERAFDAGVPFAWVTADEAYGQAAYLRDWLEHRDAAYVLALRRKDTMTTSEGVCGRAELIAALPARFWRARLDLVTLAPTTPIPSPPPPLPTTRPPTMSAVAVLTVKTRPSPTTKTHTP